MDIVRTTQDFKQSDYDMFSGVSETDAPIISEFSEGEDVGVILAAYIDEDNNGVVMIRFSDLNKKYVWERADTEKEYRAKFKDYDSAVDMYNNVYDILKRTCFEEFLLMIHTDRMFNYFE